MGGSECITNGCVNPGRRSKCITSGHVDPGVRPTAGWPLRSARGTAHAVIVT